jgi:hypothetical protein
VHCVAGLIVTDEGEAEAIVANVTVTMAALATQAERQKRSDDQQQYRNACERFS